MTAQLYKAQLHEAGMAGTRAVAITEAISELHKAFAACDVTNRNIVRDLFGNLTVDQMITDFAKTEDLAKDIFDQDAEPLEDRVYMMVKERVEENIDGLVKDSLNERLDGIDWSEYVDDYIRSKIDTIIEDPVGDEVRKILDDVTISATLHW
jgi:predicted transcriptional regulator